MSGDENWVFVAQVLRDGKYLESQTRFQDQILAGLRIYEEWEEAEKDIAKVNTLSENMFQIFNPEGYKQWKKAEDRRRKEEGVDAVIWKEPGEEMLEELRNFGL